jgi:thiol-disulfide isomerase/thioredoxin
MLAVIAVAVLFVAGVCPASAGLPAQFDSSLQAVDGGPPVKLSSFKKKVVLLEFWATYCEPCREAKPFLEELQTRFADQGLVVLAVDVGEDAKTVKEYLKTRPTTLKVLLDPWSRLQDSFFLKNEPALVLFDGNDEVVWSAAGFDPATKDEISRRLRSLLTGDRGSVPIGALK